DAVPRGGEGPRPRSRENERERRRDRARAPPRRIGRTARAYARVRAAQAREALRARVALHRRRPGDRGGHRARLKELARKTFDLADLPIVVATADDHQVDARLFHRADLASPEALLLRGPDTCRERGAGAERAQCASVFGDPLRGLQPDEETSAMLGGDPHGGVALPADPERQPLALGWLGMHADLGNLHKAAVVRERGSGPGESQHLDRLLETGLAVVRGMSERLTLLQKPARAETELEASVGKKVDGRGLLRERDGVSDDQRHYRDAEPHPLDRK